MSPRLMSLLSYSMRNKQICKTINSITADYWKLEFESELEWGIQNISPDSFEIESKNLEFSR